MTPEGWYADPFGAHGERWFSDGRPTDLVRDDSVESKDPPPVDRYDGELTELERDHATNGQDLIRADDASMGPYDAGQAADAALDAAASSGLSFG